MVIPVENGYGHAWWWPVVRWGIYDFLVLLVHIRLLTRYQATWVVRQVLSRAIYVRVGEQWERLAKCD